MIATSEDAARWCHPGVRPCRSAELWAYCFASGESGPICQGHAGASGQPARPRLRREPQRVFGFRHRVDRQGMGRDRRWRACIAVARSARPCPPRWWRHWMLPPCPPKSARSSSRSSAKRCCRSGPNIAPTSTRNWRLTSARERLTTSTSAWRTAGLKSAVNMVTALLESLETPDHLRPVLMERLTPAFAHRMVGDVYPHQRGAAEVRHRIVAARDGVHAAAVEPGLRSHPAGAAHSLMPPA